MAPRESGSGRWAHLGGHCADASHICAPWWSWRTRSWSGRRCHARSSPRRRRRSSPTLGMPPGSPCGFLSHPQPASPAHQLSGPGLLIARQTASPSLDLWSGPSRGPWPSLRTPVQGPCRGGQGGGGRGGGRSPPVQVQGATVLGLADVLEELRGLVLQHGISQDLG